VLAADDRKILLAQHIVQAEILSYGQQGTKEKTRRIERQMRMAQAGEN
jgi:hypothetical protein